MYRARRDRTRLTYAASFTWSQAKIILSFYWKYCVAGAVLFAVATMISALCEPPSYRTSAFLKIKTFDIGKTMTNNPLKDSDGNSDKELIDQQLKVINLPEFPQELLKQVQADEERKLLVLAWGIGKRFRVSLFFERLGFIERRRPKVNVDTLSGEELVALFTSIAEIRPAYMDSAIQIQVTALDERTARKVADYLAKAYVATSATFEEREINNSMVFLQSQKDTMRKRLIDAEDALKQFYKENPLLVSDVAKKSVAAEANSLAEEYSRKLEELNANQRLLAFYKKKMNSFLANIDTTTEVYNKFKEELIELKYKRKKFIFQGYAESHDGIKEIDEKISNIEKVLASAGNVSDKQVVSVGHESRLSDKVLELQDLIKKHEIDLESLKKRQLEAEEKSKILPEQEMLFNDFQREVRLSRELFEDISRRTELAEIRRASAKGMLSPIPNLAASVLVKNLPTTGRVVFAFLIGFVVSAAGFFMTAVLRKKVIDELNVSEMGLKYAGDLRPNNSHRAKVLLNLGAKYREYSEENSIVLCTSPRGEFGISQVLLLMEYLAKQKEKSLFIVVGRMDISDHFQLRSDLKYAQVFSSADGSQFLLQIFDEETLYSIRECLSLIEKQYKVKYSMIFLYIEEGAEGHCYPYGQQLADKLLLIGSSAKYSSYEYLNLVQGFKNMDEVYVALTDGSPRRMGFPSGVHEKHRAI